MPTAERDPLLPTLAIVALFAALAAWHLGIPSKMYFDEIHYVPAARKMLAHQRANIEHPLFAKETIAAAIALLGDRPWAWRVPSLVAGTLGIFAFARALWWSTRRRFAAIAGTILLATDFAWFIQSRIAMLDMVMAGLAMVAFWQTAAALHGPKPRLRLALAGTCIGLAVGAKWSVVPAVALLGVALVATRLLTRGYAPFRGVSLAEILFWFASWPLAVYWATFIPGAFWRDEPLPLANIVAWHREMLALQDSVVTRHPYQSVWYQWIVNWRAIWYLYEPVDGAQRGIVLIGNPLTMLAGLPALAWCAWDAVRNRRWQPAAALALYAVSLAMWALSGKPVQFYYHYLLPGTFLMAALALALDALWRVKRPLRWLAPATVALSCGVLLWFYPIIAAAPLHHGRDSFEHWMWLASWR
jgi:dolichyl-phosphate-mannose--protein O-mannosyl transferase